MRIVEKQRLYLYEIVHLVKALYPSKKISHSFKKDVEELADLYTPSELILLEDLIQALTLLNQLDRDKKGQTIFSNKADFENAKRLLMPNEYKLNDNDYESLLKLIEQGQTQQLTYADISEVLDCSYATTKRLVRKLKANNLIQKRAIKGIRYNVSYFDLQLENFKPSNLKEEETKHSPFDVMTEEWEDFDGFVDTQNRT